jgi:hypothetical protein
MIDLFKTAKHIQDFNDNMDFLFASERVNFGCPQEIIKEFFKGSK